VRGGTLFWSMGDNRLPPSAACSFIVRLVVYLQRRSTNLTLLPPHTPLVGSSLADNICIHPIQLYLEFANVNSEKGFGVLSGYLSSPVRIAASPKVFCGDSLYCSDGTS